jgi:hypothetical protein
MVVLQDNPEKYASIGHHPHRGEKISIKNDTNNRNMGIKTYLGKRNDP